MNNENHEIFRKSILELEGIDKNKAFRNFNYSFDLPLLVEN